MSPDLPGCVAAADTREEVIELILIANPVTGTHP
jgi:predicted RNase H-like HicB family nuclease